MRTFFFILSLGLLLFTLGCSEKVEFTRSGTPICPYCKIKVEPHTEFCSNCKRNFRYVEGKVLCWSCDGMKNCPSCRGSGKIFTAEGVRQKCTYCQIEDNTGKKVSTGVCQQCDTGAHTKYGSAPVPIYSER